MLRALAIDALTAEGVVVRPTGTTVVIDGPRFATRAESRFHAASGGTTINMTLAPETPLALELGVGVVNCSFVTDSDSAVERGHEDAVSAALVMQRLRDAQPVIRRAIAAIVARIPDGFATEPGVPADAIAEVLARPRAGPGMSGVVLVTGGAGFIGGAVVDAAAGGGPDRPGARLLPRRRARRGCGARAHGVETVIGDVDGSRAPSRRPSTASTP